MICIGYRLIVLFPYTDRHTVRATEKLVEEKRKERSQLDRNLKPKTFRFWTKLFFVFDEKPLGIKYYIRRKKNSLLQNIHWKMKRLKIEKTVLALLQIKRPHWFHHHVGKIVSTITIPKLTIILMLFLHKFNAESGNHGITYWFYYYFFDW